MTDTQTMDVDNITKAVGAIAALTVALLGLTQYLSYENRLRRELEVEAKLLDSTPQDSPLRPLISNHYLSKLGLYAVYQSNKYEKMSRRSNRWMGNFLAGLALLMWLLITYVYVMDDKSPVLARFIGWLIFTSVVYGLLFAAAAMSSSYARGNKYLTRYEQLARQQESEVTGA